jgi:hypothetical protein
MIASGFKENPPVERVILSFDLIFLVKQKNENLWQ